MEVMAKGFFDGSAMEVGVNGMGCAMGCVCKRREFSMGCGWISDGVGFDFRWVWLKGKGVFGGWIGNEVYEGNLGKKKGV
ncbi:unnamed protein product [Prunus armeniaca]